MDTHVSKMIRSLSPEIDLGKFLTMCGVEYEFTWINESVASGTKVYLLATTHPSKFTLLNHREITIDKERGFYKAYTGFTPGNVVSTLPIFKLRADSTINSGAVIQTLDGASGIDINTKTIDQPIFGIPGSGGGSAAASGDLSEDNAIRIIPPNTQFLIEFENDSDLSTYFRLLLKWWEVSPESLMGVRDV